MRWLSPSVVSAIVINSLIFCTIPINVSFLRGTPIIYFHCIQTMRSALLILTATLVPSSAFVSVSLCRIHQRIAIHASNSDDHNNDDDVPILQRTLDSSNLLTPIDPIDQKERQKQPALIETIGGGTTMIFEMARRMLVWDESERKSNTLPRWHPHSGVSDVNPSFRTQSPIMNNQGYASTIWRNVRKRNKPSLWRYALRTYDRMEEAANDTKTSVLRIERNWIHHEGALLACAKLGLWKEALDIFETIQTEERQKIGVTDHMVFSLVKACVRGSKALKASENSLEQRRAPLDAAAAALAAMEWNEFPLVAKHVNPLASAYQSLGLEEDARNILQDNLGDRSIGPEPEFGSETLNVHDLTAKDKASYALLVRGAIASGSWANAVEALEDMTGAGLYPTTSHLNQWTEASERKTRQRTTRSWKKRRDEYWLESVR